MPLIHIYLQEGQAPSQIKTLGDTIHEVLMETWDIPKDDKFHLIHEVPKSFFQMNKQMWDMQRSDDLVVLHITTSPRTLKMKRDFYKALSIRLNDRINLKPDDLFISIITNNKEDWSFGHGEMQLMDE